MVRLRELLEKAILRGNRELAEDILNRYPTRTNVDKMYRSRMRVCLSYRIDHDYESAKQQLQDAIALTLPGFTYERIDKYRISTIEMENLLAVERIGIENRPERTKNQEKLHLEILMAYINMSLLIIGVI